MTKKVNRKSSARRKLIPAVGMLTVSAMMLSSATYAWFTMSREVEVTGIKMTASVPEDLQISLGDGMLSTVNNKTNTLQGTVSTTAGSTGRLTGMVSPGAADSDTDWTNVVAISDYYQLGKLTPATSATGRNIVYTDDATIVGQTLNAASEFKDALGSNNFSAAVDLKANKTETSGWTDSYANGGAYYIDIPVWFRTSSKETDGVNLAVIANITKGTNADKAGNRTDGDSQAQDLYKAARVAIIAGDGTVGTAKNDADVSGVTGSMAGTTQAAGVIYKATANTQAADGDTFQSGYYRTAGEGTDDVVAYDGTTYQAVAINSEDTGGAYTWDGPGNISGNDALERTAVKMVTQATNAQNGGYTGDNVVNVKGPQGESTQNYGTPTRYTIRVWLEGEDVNCWNATAGQDFNIDLKFVNKKAATNPNAGNTGTGG